MSEQFDYKKDFVVFILSYGRSRNIKTKYLLDKNNYTGDYYIICSKDDKSLDDYKKLYNNVIVFDKNDYIYKTDTIDNFNELRNVLFARNASYDIANKLNKRFFLQLDDDYDTLDYGFPFKIERPQGKKTLYENNLDYLFKKTLEFFINIDFDIIAYAQRGDLVGGEGFCDRVYQKRKIMNSFFCRTDRRIWFKGTSNEDVNTYLYYGQRGYKFLTIPYVTINQETTQKQSGGLTDFYKNYGTYVKSFYSIIINPIAVKLDLMGNKYKRIHHKINWDLAVPYIISDKYKK